MTTQKKNQHYLPKFYLRNFSYNKNGKQIGLYNISRSFFHSTAPLKHQASRNFYYGKDGLIEDRLAHIESQLVKPIKAIIDTMCLPQKNTDEHYHLIYFITLTILRNPTMIEMSEKFRKELSNKITTLDKSANINRLIPNTTHEESVERSLSQVPFMSSIILDLDYKLLVNETNVPFISSDFPVVRYNQFLESRKWQHGKTGFGSIGLQFFLPLTSSLTLVLYDSNVYKVGAKKQKKHILKNDNDIKQLNILQILNCINTVYFDEKVSEAFIKETQQIAYRHIRANEIKSKLGHVVERGQHDYITNGNGKKENLIIVTASDCEIKLNINGIKQHSNSKAIKLGNKVAQVRPWVKEVEEFYEKLQSNVT